MSNGVQQRAMSVAELAAAWSVSEIHIKNLIRRGALPVFHVGARVLIPVTVIERIERGELEVR